MRPPKPDLRFETPNPADNAPIWEEDPDRVVARLMGEPEIGAITRVGGSQRIHVVLRHPDGRPMSTEEAELLLCRHGLEVVTATPAVAVIARVRPVALMLPAGATIPDVEAALTSPAGPRALFRDDTGAMVCVTAHNRVSLVYYLADAVRSDRRDGLAEAEIGWRSNRQASIAVWGRAGGEDSRRLKSLLFNLRGELRAGGIDPWCIDKRRGAVRLRVRDARLAQA
jgi:hypothetical protein